MKPVSLNMISLLILVMAASLQIASGSYEPRTMAMAGANLVRARGVEGSLMNPANLGMDGNGGLNIKLFYIGAMAGNNSFDLSDYKRINGAFLDEGDKKTLLEDIPSSGFKASSDLNALLLGLSVGRAALTVDMRSAESLHLPKDMFSLALFGNELNRTYSLGMTDMGDVWTVAATTLSYGQPIKTGVFKKMAVGIGIKHLMGINYVKAGGSMDMTTTGSGFTNSGVIEILTAGESAYDTRRLNMNGSGFAADIGLTCQMNDHWSFGAALMNLSNGITWKNDIKRRSVSLDVDQMTLLSLSDNGNYSGKNIVENTDIPGGILRSRYPGSFSAGIAFENKYFSAEANIKRGFYNGAGTSDRWQFAEGTEIRLLPIIPLRAGFGIVDNRTILFSLGCGLEFGFLRFDAALVSIGFPGSNSRGMGAGASASLKF